MGPSYNEQMLTPRQELILKLVVEGYLQAGQPVGSKALAAGVEWGPSTVRNELAMLEEQGCSRIRTPPPAASRPMPATATTSTACSASRRRRP